MIRDFSQDAKSELETLVKQVEDEKLCDFTDWIGDRWLDFESWIGLLNVKRYIDDINAYHKKVIDKNNTTLSDIERIFNAAYGVDSSSSRKIKEVVESCRAYNNLLKELSGVISPTGELLTYEEIKNILGVKFENYSQLLLNLGQWEAYLENFLEKCKLNGGPTQEDKEECIRIFEEHNAEYAEQLNSFLGKLSEDEIREIKFIIYTAEEPYRSIYLENFNKYSIGNISGSDTGYFTPGKNTINVNMPEEPGNPRGPYVTFFHESGHAIDYNYEDDGSYFSMTYRNADGQSLQDVLYEDVSKDVESVISRYVNNQDTVDKIHSYIMGADDSKYNELSKSEQNILKQVQDYYKQELAGAVNEAASDVYGGVTCNIISGSYGHWSDDYWYKNGEATYAQSRELWAEYYSYCSTGNEASMESLTEKFPNAKKFMDEMAGAMVE